MGINDRLVQSANMEQILGEYKLILEKKSKYSKAVRDKVVARAERYLGTPNKLTENYL
ncbi:hypothetical protein [Flavobacterium sp. UBA6046]|jgi:hypothetical protein|uniref:hypothetical protein n=1 Tax=Flavobacterium sp. UBA6046 TaxID=1946552 RepID=UPI0025C0FF1B|nr:hypothetical protein [Flavobacterium sp. UBA6046]